MTFEDDCYYNISRRLYICVIILNVLHRTHGTIATPSVAECAKPGIGMGAGLGAVAGGAAGATLLTHLGIGSMTFATCPTLALTTLAGTGTGLLAGPLLPLGEVY